MSSPQSAERLGRLQERAEHVGIEITTSTDDSGRPVFIATKWALTKRLQTLDALAAWVAMVDGRAEV